MEKIEGEYNWCDFFTPCPYHRCVEVGSFDCYECEFNRGIGITTSVPRGDYHTTGKLYALCVYAEQNKV